LPPEILKTIYVLIPNETELSILSGMNVCDLESAEAAARKLMEVGTFSVIVTLGEKGALCVNRSGDAFLVPAFSVDVVDTTAAGDAFIAGLVVAQVHGLSGREAIRYANACGALAATRFGAQPSLPTGEEVARFLAQNS
jgi:ribokinase